MHAGRVLPPAPDRQPYSSRETLAGRKLNACGRWGGHLLNIQATAVRQWLEYQLLLK